MPTGIADYTYELLTGLADARACTVVCEDGVGDVQAPSGVVMIALAEYQSRSAEFADTAHLYHLGNNPDHVYMLPTLAARPGVVVLHDPGLHYLFDCATAARGEFAAYAAAIGAAYGGPGRVLAQQFLDMRLRGSAMTHDMTMLASIVGPARGVIVHSQFAAAKVWAEAPSAAITHIPHHYLPPATAPRNRAEVRAALGVAKTEILFLSLGFVTHTKCLDRALTALTLVADDMPPFRYVVAGETRAGEPDIRQLADQMGLGDRVITIGFVPEAQFYDLLEAADVVINLRHPVGGETSGTCIRALGRGAACVVVDRGPFAEIPDGAAEKVPWGADFDRRLGVALRRLAQEPRRRARIGAAAAAYVARAHRLEDSVAGYLHAIIAAETRATPVWHSSATWSYPPPASPRPLDGALWQRAGALPLPASGVHGLCIAAEPVLAPDWTWEIASLDRLPDAELAYDLVLIVTEARALADRAAQVLRTINALLRFGGMLVLNLTRAEDGPRGALESHTDGTDLLEARGFTVQDHATEAEATLLAPQDLPVQEEHCWRATKTSAFLARPEWRAL
jgi:glycosyltransferase involved in cell wall biosynthesis